VLRRFAGLMMKHVMFFGSCGNRDSAVGRKISTTSVGNRRLLYSTCGKFWPLKGIDGRYLGISPAVVSAGVPSRGTNGLHTSTRRGQKFPDAAVSFPVIRNTFPVNFCREFDEKPLRCSGFLHQTRLLSPQNREIPCKIPC
jgi:hypothetical protein